MTTLLLPCNILKSLNQPRSNLNLPHNNPNPRCNNHIYICVYIYICTLVHNHLKCTSLYLITSLHLLATSQGLLHDNPQPTSQQAQTCVIAAAGITYNKATAPVARGAFVHVHMSKARRERTFENRTWHVKMLGPK